MKKEIRSIPGMRRPTSQEHAWICPQWSEEIRVRLVEKSGKGIRYFGIFLMVLAAASALRGTDGLGAALLLLGFGVSCLLIGRSVKRNSDRRAFLLNAFAQGNYLVAPATSTQIASGGGSGRALGYVKARLPGGEPLDGLISVPYRSITPLLRQKVHSAPILLIRVPEYPEIFAIPIPSDERM